jgi:hypothetical protein
MTRRERFWLVVLSPLLVFLLVWAIVGGALGVGPFGGRG